jgi:hypothetical protein
MEIQQLPPPLVTDLLGPLGRPHNVGEQHRGQQPLGPTGGLELHGIHHHVAEPAREFDLVAVGCLPEVRGRPGGLARDRLVGLVVEGQLARAPGHMDPGRGAHGAMDGEVAGPGEPEQDRAGRSGQRHLRLPGGVLDLHAQESDRAQVGAQLLQAPGRLDPPAHRRVQGELGGLPAPVAGPEPGAVLDGHHPTPYPDCRLGALQPGPVQILQRGVGGDGDVTGAHEPQPPGSA